MYCTHCGAEIEDSAKYCVSCGEPVEEQSKGSDGNSTFKAETYSAPPKNPKGGKDNLNKTLTWILIALVVVVIIMVAVIATNNQKEKSNIQKTTTEVSTIEEEARTVEKVSNTTRRSVTKTETGNREKYNSKPLEHYYYDESIFSNHKHYYLSQERAEFSDIILNQLDQAKQDNNVVIVPTTAYKDSGDLKVQFIIYNGTSSRVKDITFDYGNVYYSVDNQNVTPIVSFKKDTAFTYQNKNIGLYPDEFTVVTLTFNDPYSPYYSYNGNIDFPENFDIYIDYYIWWNWA